MEQYPKIYSRNQLFNGVDDDAMPALLSCLHAQKRLFARGAVICAAGEPSAQMGIVISGRVQTVYEDALGKRGIISVIEPGRLFCDAFSCTNDRKPTVNIMAQTDCAAMMMDIDAVLHTCSRACGQHQLVIENLVHILAEKYVTLNRKLLHLSGRTTRRKLLSYLFEQSKMAGGAEFAIPLNQQELADYLFIDRSGLSTEFNRLRKEGILRGGDGRYWLQIEPDAVFE